jgi:hypothetical protein
MAECNLTALFTRFVHIFGEERGRNLMCEHCDAMTEVLNQLTGQKVAAVIMKRTAAKVHGLDTEQVSRTVLVATTA